MTTKEFIEKAKKIHGNKYDYKETEYINSKNKVKIYCYIHKGYFSQRVSHHLKGHGCYICKGTKRLTTEEFVKRAKEIYGDKYDYSETIYINRRTNVKIYCNIHKGFFYQRASHHLDGHECGFCTEKRKLTVEEFIIKSRKIHKDKYNYFEVKYIDNKTEVLIFCKKHKKFFYQVPSIHLRGSGCPNCGNEIISIKHTKDEQKFIEEAMLIHGGKYDYSRINYKNAKTKVIIICKKNGHGRFEQSPDQHLRGAGCPNCHKKK